MQNAKLSIAIATQLYRKYGEQLLELHGHEIAFRQYVKELIESIFVLIEDDETADATKYIQDSLDKAMILRSLEEDCENSKIAQEGDKVNGWLEGQ